MGVRVHMRTCMCVSVRYLLKDTLLQLILLIPVEALSVYSVFFFTHGFSIHFGQLLLEYVAFTVQ